MKTTMTRHLTILALLMALAVPAARAWEWPKKPTANTGADTTQTQGKTGLGALIGGIVNAVKGNKGLEIANLEGTWVYEKPAVSFKSDNFLLKAGGAAAKGTIESKIAPYYKTVGLEKLQLTINADSTFTFKTGLANMSGTLEPDPENDKALLFEFKAFKKIKIGKMSGEVELKGDEMTITYEASKLLKLAQAVGKLTGMKTVNALADLLGKYDGLTVGYTLRKNAE